MVSSIYITIVMTHMSHVVICTLFVYFLFLIASRVMYHGFFAGVLPVRGCEVICDSVVDPWATGREPAASE